MTLLSAMASPSSFSRSCLGQRFALEVLHHQVVVDLGGLVGELLASGLGSGGVLGRDVLRVLAIVLMVVGLHADDVDDAVEVGLGAHGELYRHDAVAERRGELGETRVEVGVLLVHPVDEDGSGDAHLAGDLPQAFRLDLRTSDRVDDEQRHLGGLHAGDSVGNEVGVSGRVDHVDLHAIVDHRCEREVERERALDLLGVVVEGRVTSVDTPESFRGAGQIEHRLCERGLSRTAVSD